MWPQVNASWKNAYGACGPAAAELLRAVSTLDLEVVSSPAAGVAAGLSLAETEAALAELVREGWAKPVAGSEHRAIDARGRAWLSRNVAPLEAGSVIASFAEYHTSAMTAPWLIEHRGEVLMAVRSCDRERLRGTGARLAAASWPFAGGLGDPSWCERLAAVGEALAIADRDPGTLASLLSGSAAAFAAQGDRPRAEAQWVRALAIVRRAGLDPAAVLTALGGLYREWGRLGKALDADLGLVDLRRSAADPVGTARALATVADTMRAAGRLGSAADYLAQADEALTDVSAPPPELLAVHAQILVSWGRALWDQDQPGPARRQWSRALAMLIDVDDHAADQVRALLATAPGDPLP